MARLDWDRLRRVHPLDGADPRVDPDGAVLWEREASQRDRAARERVEAELGVRRLRAGIIVRRARERGEADPSRVEEGAVERTAGRADTPSVARPPLDPSAWIECPRCKARLPRRTLLLHARASCTRRGDARG